MDDPVAAERENLRRELARLSRLRANVQPNQDAVKAVEEIMGERYARLEELVRGERNPAAVRRRVRRGLFRRGGP